VRQHGRAYHNRPVYEADRGFYKAFKVYPRPSRATFQIIGNQIRPLRRARSFQQSAVDRRDHGKGIRGCRERRPMLRRWGRSGHLAPGCPSASSDSRGISESALALIALRALLSSNAPAPNVPQSAGTREPATDRITIRLRPGDGRAIHERAARRGFKPSAYIAALVRAHVARNPPLPSNELAIRKRAGVAQCTGGDFQGRLCESAGACPSMPARIDDA
jgi:hypothetical protein